MSINQLVEIKNEGNLLTAVWLRQLLTLASGALAILAGLAPHTTSRTGMYFLAATWIFLGLGIVFGSSATYLEVIEQIGNGVCFGAGYSICQRDR